jgi:hypothetical protein
MQDIGSQEIKQFAAQIAGIAYQDAQKILIYQDFYVTPTIACRGKKASVYGSSSKYCSLKIG